MKVNVYPVNIEHPDSSRSAFHVAVSSRKTLVLAGDRYLLNCSVNPRMEMEEGAMFKFSPDQDAIVPADESIWDEFSWKIGKYELANIPGEPRGDLSPVMQKVNGHWRPFVTDFAPTIASIMPAAARGDRMILTARGLGVLEYDGKNDRWARLVNSPVNIGGTACARLDEHRRRLIATERCFLIYDGDPFVADGWQAISLRPLAPAEIEELSRLIKQLDDDKYAVRAAATERLKTFIPWKFNTFKKMAADESLPAEVRNRLTEILENAGLEAKYTTKLPVLLEHDCPPPPPLTAARQ